MFALASVANAQDMASGCGPLENHYGPFDYRTATNRSIVENVHFTPKVESLKGGNTSITAGGDINYTLRVYPNHQRALMAVMRLGEKEKRAQPRDMEYTVECWLERAERFQPDDSVVKGLYGVYLVRAGRPKDGVAKLDQALQSGGENANVRYNLGLAYFDLKRYDESLENAHKAYAMGFPLPGLRDKLKRAGKWRDASSAAQAPN
jgi:tetratricopeptide (TPR) repeat protein